MKEQLVRTLNAWGFVLNVTTQFSGGGSSVFSPEMLQKYAPHPATCHVARSIYFQMLEEYGWFGLAMLLAMHACACRWDAGHPPLQRQARAGMSGMLARMCQVSQINYSVAGAFLIPPYYDFAYYIIAIVTLGKCRSELIRPTISRPCACRSASTRLRGGR